MIYSILGIVVILIIITWSLPLQIDEKSVITTAISTVALAVVTAIYAWYTRKMADEMKKQRHEAIRPIIDIEVQPEGPQELAKQVYAAHQGILPIEMICILRNIGVGPAIDLHSFILNYETTEKHRFEIGTLGKDQATRTIDLATVKNSVGTMLVAFYKDVYGNLYVSNRRITIDKDKNYHIEGLTIETVMTTEENEIYD